MSVNSESFLLETLGKANALMTLLLNSIKEHDIELPDGFNKQLADYMNSITKVSGIYSARALSEVQ